MLFAGLIGLVNRFDVRPVWPTFYLCFEANVLYVLAIRCNLKTSLGNALTLIDHLNCNVSSQLIK